MHACPIHRKCQPSDWLCVQDKPFGFVARPSQQPDGCAVLHHAMQTLCRHQAFVLCSSDNVFVWECTVPGKEGTDWAGGHYPVTLRFPDNFPTSPPEVRCHIRACSLCVRLTDKMATGLLPSRLLAPQHLPQRPRLLEHPGRGGPAPASSTTFASCCSDVCCIS